MRAKMSLALALVGLVLIAVAFTQSGQGKIAMIILGLIIACAGCLFYLANGWFAQEHRSFVLIVSILFIILVVAYAIKLM